MQSNELPFEKILFVCTNKRDKGDRVSCGREGSCELRDRMKELVKARDLKGKVRVSTSGCMDVCEEGPNVMVFPDNLWLSRVKEKDIPAILDAVVESIEKGTPVKLPNPK